MPVLTSLSRLKGALQIPAGVTVHDARLSDLIDEVEGDLLDRLNLDSWDPTFYTEYHDTTSVTRVVLLNRFPVIAVAAATLVADSTLLVEGTDYEVDASGRFAFLPDCAVPFGRRKLVVTYSAGPITVAGSTPGHLIRLATLASARQYQLEPIAGLASAELRPMKKTVGVPDSDPILREIETILSRYRDPM